MGARDSSPTAFCACCGDPIEGCDGLLGEWMHTATRAERCAAGVTVATPERAGASDMTVAPRWVA